MALKGMLEVECMSWFPNIEIKPYFEDECVVIFHADCRDILPLLEPGSVDLVLTDPPYGINYITSWRLRSDPLVHNIQGDDEYPREVIEDCRRIASVGVLAFARGEPIKAQSTLVWVKNNWSVGDLEHGYANMWESVLWFAGKCHKWANGRPSNVMFADRVSAEQLEHPTQKPVSLIRQLLLHHEANVILDPFLGSGTTARAAKDLGRKCVGIEIEERYCEIAANRMAQTVMQL